MRDDLFFYGFLILSALAFFGMITVGIYMEGTENIACIEAGGSVFSGSCVLPDARP